MSEYLWKLEQPAHAAANGYFMGCINRVGTEKPWDLGEFYGTSYFVNPRGQIIAEASRDKDELLVAEFDLDLIDLIFLDMFTPLLMYERELVTGFISFRHKGRVLKIDHHLFVPHSHNP